MNEEKLCPYCGERKIPTASKCYYCAIVESHLEYFLSSEEGKKFALDKLKVKKQ